MEINNTPIRTSVNYGMNNFKVDDGTFAGSAKKYNGFSCSGLAKQNKVIIDAKLSGTYAQMQSMLSNESYQELQKANSKIEVKINETQPLPIVLNFNFDNKNDYLVSRIFVSVSQNVKAKIIINFASSEKAYHNGHIKFACGAGSEVSAIVVFDMSMESSNFVVYENEIKENAKLNFKIIDFAGEYSVSKYEAKLSEKNAKSTLKTLYLGAKNAKIDLNLIQNVFGECSEANTIVVGALAGSASKNFKGTIDFKKGCKKSKGEESELCLLLSKNAKSKALPILLCTEEDVDGSHSTAVGKIEDRELFYLMSRGLSRAEALKILVNA